MSIPAADRIRPQRGLSITVTISGISDIVEASLLNYGLNHDLCPCLAVQFYPQHGATSVNLTRSLKSGVLYSQVLALEGVLVQGTSSEEAWCPPRDAARSNFLSWSIPQKRHRRDGLVWLSGQAALKSTAPVDGLCCSRRRHQAVSSPQGDGLPCCGGCTL